MSCVISTSAKASSVPFLESYEMAMHNPLTRSFICTAQVADTAVIKPSMTKGFLNSTQASIAPRIASNIKAPLHGLRFYELFQLHCQK